MSAFSPAAAPPSTAAKYRRSSIPKPTAFHSYSLRLLQTTTSCFSSLSAEAPSPLPMSPIVFTSAVGSPVLPPATSARWTLESRHILMLNVIACATAISASWLFFSAIPTIQAFRRAAESLEKLLDVAAEELPDTMAAVRLSGMEISDLTMELSDLGQEITQGVRNSTRAVHFAEDKLRHFTTTTPTVPIPGQVNPRNNKEEPALAKTARNLRENLVKGRVFLGMVLSVSQFSRWTWNYLASHRRKQPL